MQACTTTVDECIETHAKVATCSLLKALAGVSRNSDTLLPHDAEDYCRDIPPLRAESFVLPPTTSEPLPPLVLKLEARPDKIYSILSQTSGVPKISINELGTLVASRFDGKCTEPEITNAQNALWRRIGKSTDTATSAPTRICMHPNVMIEEIHWATIEPDKLKDASVGHIGLETQVYGRMIGIKYQIAGDAWASYAVKSGTKATMEPTAGTPPVTTKKKDVHAEIEKFTFTSDPVDVRLDPRTIKKGLGGWDKARILLEGRDARVVAVIQRFNLKISPEPSEPTPTLAVMFYNIGDFFDADRCRCTPAASAVGRAHDGITSSRPGEGHGPFGTQENHCSGPAILPGLVVIYPELPEGNKSCPVGVGKLSRGKGECD